MEISVKFRPDNGSIRVTRLLICFLCVLAFPIAGHREVGAPPRESWVVKTLSGKALASFFEGLPPSPSNSLSRVLSHAERSCASKTSSLISFVRLPERVVFASECIATPCSGSHWESFYDWCTGMACFGTREVSNWNPNAPECNGICQNRRHCGSSPECGCESPICDSCDPYTTCG